MSQAKRQDRVNNFIDQTFGSIFSHDLQRNSLQCFFFFSRKRSLFRNQCHYQELIQCLNCAEITIIWVQESFKDHSPSAYTFDPSAGVIGMLFNMKNNESFQVFNFNFEFYTVFNHFHGFTATIQETMHYSHTLYTGT